MKNHWYLYQFLFLTFTVSWLVPYSAQAQISDTDAQEVYMDFRYRGVINNVVIAYYYDNTFYLPITELFDLLGFDYSINGLVVSGKYARQQTPYSFDFANFALIYDKDKVELHPDDFILGDLDFYIRPELFDKYFGLGFSVNFNNMTLQLDTNVPIPSVEKLLRSRSRSRAKVFSERDLYDLKYGRNMPILDGGFLDYNLSSAHTRDKNSYRFNGNLGLQVMGGDLQGNLFGSYDNTTNLGTFNTGGLRWRYLMRDNPVLTHLELGQLSSDGTISNQYTGIRLTNQPVEPRFMFDEFEIHGFTEPESEIELYLNNMLVDYQISDDLGSYRFLTPITYGASEFDIKIYGPTGQIIERSSRIDIPFNFQPTGVFNYTFNAGRLATPMLGSTKRNYMTSGTGSYGLSDWLTLNAGVTYFDNHNNNTPYYSGSLSSRIFSQYILTLEGVTDAYYRGSLSMINAKSTSINVDYTEYTSTRSIYNSTGDDRNIKANIYHPLNIFGIPISLRLSTTSRIKNNINNFSYRADANLNLGKLGLRFGYSDRTIGIPKDFKTSTAALLEGSLTYRMTQNPSIPAFLRGFYLRAGMRYHPQSSQLQSIDMMLSRNIFRSGQLQLGFNRNLMNNFNSFRFSLVIDFNVLRSGTNVNYMRNSASVTQNIRGSIGFDTNYNNILFTSRNQVGRSGMAVNLFVDNDSDGKYTHGVDDPITDNAIRLDRTGATYMNKKGILYITQMQPYYYYNVDINKNALRNPMLVPDFEKFGLISDPNRFKKIEVPFYMSGVIEGGVSRVYGDNQKAGVGGLRLFLENKNTDYRKEIRTFSDGSFYEFEVPPGDYRLYVDQNNLDILKAESKPEMLEFTVEALPDGDFVEGLEILLYPLDYGTPEKEAEYDLVDKVLRYIVLSQNEFYKRNFNKAFEYVNQSLETYETAQGYALKGSLYYMTGDTDLALENWDKAKSIEPNIYIPEMELLDKRIKK